MKRVVLRTILSGSAIAALVAFSSMAVAQYQGSGGANVRGGNQASSTQETLRTVQWVKDNGRDDQRVLLRGRIISHIGGEHYMFADDSGEIQVDIDNDEFRGQAVDQNTLVEIWGEIDFDDGRLEEINVRSLKVVK